MPINFLAGQVLVFDKPLGMTSFGLVAKVRWLLTRAMGGRKIKVGHAGTLDPLASGVMLLCTGRATKQIETLQAGTKTYEATIQLGATTPSFDLEHAIDATYPTDHLSRDVVEQALDAFRGDIMQVPPVFSACKVEGKRAYDLARKGQDVALQAKPIHIYEYVLTNYRDDTHQADVRIVCSKGTYIRSLARDLGEALGCGAHLTALRRTAVGDHDLSHAFTIEAFEAWLATQDIDTQLPA